MQLTKVQDSMCSLIGAFVIHSLESGLQIFAPNLGTLKFQDSSQSQ